MDGVRNLYALANLRDPALADEVLELALTKVRTQNAPFLLGGMLANRHIAARTWAFIEGHFDEMQRRFPSSSIPRMLDGLPGLAELEEDGRPRYLAAVLAFYRERVQGGRRRLVAQSIERLAINVRLAGVAGDQLAELLQPR
jgi:puromycin-sensitive aminopeptidase